MIKAIYYSKKMNKYYFCEKTVFGDFRTITVYGVEKVDPSTLTFKEDKNGKKYFLGELVKTISEKGFIYYTCKGAAETGAVKESELQSQSAE